MEVGTGSLPPDTPELPERADNGGAEDPRKRKRITLACQRCRKRKGRCDGAKPACSNCVAAGVDCHPAEPEQDGRKRKRPHVGRMSATPALIETGFLQHGGGVGLGSQSSPQASGASIFDPQRAIFNLDASLGSPGGGMVNVQPPPGSNQSGGTPGERDLLDLFTGFHHESGAGPMEQNNGVVVPQRQPEPPQPHVQFQDPSPQPNVAEPALLLHYYRPFGPTAIQPGLEQIGIAMRAPPMNSRAQSPAQDSPESSFHSSLDFPYSAQFPTTHTSFPFAYPGPNSHGGSVNRIFDEDSDIPRAEVLQALYPVFFDKLGCHFPFLSMSLMMGLESDESSKRVNAPLLMNAVCALAARFSESPLITGSSRTRLPATYGVPFADKAKQILVPLLGYPSSNTVAALLLLAYYEFGLNSEGALWMYSGMALRMAQDLGLHQDINCNRPDVSALQKASDNLLWWSCVVLDRTLALGTGRPVTIKDAEITASLPTAEEVATVASTSYVTSPDGLAKAPPSAFPFVVQFFLLYGQICEIVNLPRSAWKPSQNESSHPPSRSDTDDPGASRPAEAASTTSEHTSALCGIEDAITAAYNVLPVEMTFTSANFKMHAKSGGGATFLHLHLWYNCILILLYRPPLIYPRTNSSNLCLADRLAVVNNSCLTIGQLLSCAEIVDEYSYLASPFINQCFFVAASAWIQDYRIRTGRNVLASTSGDKLNDAKTSGGLHNSSATILAQVAVQNLGLCKAALDKQARYWLGVGWIAALVNKQGMKKSKTSLKAATEGVETFVSGPEMAIFRRLVPRFKRSNGMLVPSPDVNDESMTQLLSMLAQEDFGGPSMNFTPDDFALAYTFASVFPESSGVMGQSQSDFPFAI